MTIFLTRTFGEVLKQYSVSSYMSSTEPILFRGTINRTFLVAIFWNNLWVATGSTEPMLFRGTINRSFLVAIFSNNLWVATCFQLNPYYLEANSLSQYSQIIFEYLHVFNWFHIIQGYDKTHIPCSTIVQCHKLLYSNAFSLCTIYIINESFMLFFFYKIRWYLFCIP